MTRVGVFPRASALSLPWSLFDQGFPVFLVDLAIAVPFRGRDSIEPCGYVKREKRRRARDAPPVVAYESSSRAARISLMMSRTKPTIAEAKASLC